MQILFHVAMIKLYKQNRSGHLITAKTKTQLTILPNHQYQENYAVANSSGFNSSPGSTSIVRSMLLGLDGNIKELVPSCALTNLSPLFETILEMLVELSQIKAGIFSFLFVKFRFLSPVSIDSLQSVLNYFPPFDSKMPIRTSIPQSYSGHNDTRNFVKNENS